MKKSKGNIRSKASTHNVLHEVTGHFKNNDSEFSERLRGGRALGLIEMSKTLTYVIRRLFLKDRHSVISLLVDCVLLGAVYYLELCITWRL